MLSGGRDDGIAESDGATAAVGAGDVPAGFTGIKKAATMDKTQPTTKRTFSVRVIFLREC